MKMDGEARCMRWQGRQIAKFRNFDGEEARVLAKNSHSPKKMRGGQTGYCIWIGVQKEHAGQPPLCHPNRQKARKPRPVLEAVDCLKMACGRVADS